MSCIKFCQLFKCVFRVDMVIKLQLVKKIYSYVACLRAARAKWHEAVHLKIYQYFGTKKYYVSKETALFYVKYLNNEKT